MSEKRNTNGFGLGSVLFLIFLVLKLAEIGPVRYWSWWWVTAPLWLPLLVVIVIMGLIALVYYMKN